MERCKKHEYSQNHAEKKKIWEANKYKHCTMPSYPNPVFVRLDISLQSTRTLANACQNYDVNECYIGGSLLLLIPVLR
ncbi:hypothetical protein VP01_2470g4 [Puccinia sorghi]|uniref:Uncharacterized protein n=1 Tax=Puccinia sorghi TaxID=27349 RepID=A0A0L6V6M0_9BASI|nr:hypothetical protein VP01_2470g4 [Puccinia sorghi]